MALSLPTGLNLASVSADGTLVLKHGETSLIFIYNQCCAIQLVQQNRVD
jgi:hypothetical protein